MTPEQMENGRTGIELMTAWVGSDSNNDFLAERVRALLDEADTTTGKYVVAANALAGVAAVAAEAILVLAALTKRTEEEVLQEIAKKFQQPEEGA
jgi:hypothetical protein